MTSSPLLEIRAVSITAASAAHPLVHQFDLSVDRGSTVAIVGESGSGKSLSITAPFHLAGSAVHRSNGSVMFDGDRVDDAAIRRLLGSEIGFVFQEPLTSFDPRMSVGKQIVEHVRRQRRLSRRTARDLAVELMRSVGINDAERRVDSYPHQLSGGMRQRAAIATALAAAPSVLVADEPTTALDVTVQAQILDLVRDLQRERNLAVVWITHDLGVVN